VFCKNQIRCRFKTKNEKMRKEKRERKWSALGLVSAARARFQVRGFTQGFVSTQ
jgi:hypothetical protein